MDIIGTSRGFIIDDFVVFCDCGCSALRFESWTDRDKNGKIIPCTMINIYTSVPLGAQRRLKYFPYCFHMDYEKLVELYDFLTNCKKGDLHLSSASYSRKHFIDMRVDKGGDGTLGFTFSVIKDKEPLKSFAKNREVMGLFLAAKEKEQLIVRLQTTVLKIQELLYEPCSP